MVPVTFAVPSYTVYSTNRGLFRYTINIVYHLTTFYQLKF